MYSVLYVDDEPGLLEIGKLFIEQSGDFTVTTMESAEEALRSPVIHSCNAIVSDYLMPGMDGIAFLKAIRKDHGDIPFILFTGRGREEVVIEAINNGADFYLQKGGDPMAQFAELTHKIRQAIRWRQVQVEQATSEKKFSEVFFKSPILSSMISLEDGKYLEVNDAFLGTTGYTRGEVIGKTFRDLQIIADSRAAETLTRAARAGGEIRNLEIGMRTKSGVIRTMLLSQDTLMTDAEALVFSQAIDITDSKQAQDRLRDSEQRLTDIINFLPDATFAIDRNGTVIAWSRAMEEMTGVPADRILGKGNHEYSLPFYGERRSILIDLIFSSPEEIREHYSQIIKTGAMLAAETSLPRVQGSPRVLWGKASPLYNRDGQIVGAIESIRDITESKKAELALIESERQYRDLFENSVLGIFRTTPEGVFTSINPTFARISGYNSPDEMIEAIRDVRTQLYVNPEDRTVFMGKLAADGFVKDHEARFFHRDGHVLWIAINAIAVRDPAGNLRYFEGTIEDITERKRAEEELRGQYEELTRSEQRFRESEARFRMLLETMQDAVIILDLSGSYLYANKAAFHLAGLPESTDPAGFSLERFLDPASVSRAVAGLEQVRTGGGPFTGEYQIRTLSGELRWIEGTGIKISYLGSDCDLVTLRDTTEQQRAEEALRESELKYRAIFENTGTATILIEEDTVISLANSEFERLSGYLREEIVNRKKWTDFVVQEDRERMLAQHRERRVHSAQALRHYEFRFRQRSGEIRYIFLTVDVIPGTTRSIASMQDITERKLAEEKLVAANTEYVNLLSQIQDVYYRSDREGRLIKASRSLSELLGYEDPGELIGRDIAHMFYFHPDDRKPLLEALAKNGKVTEFEITLKHRNGIPVLAATSTHYYYDKDGTVLGVEGTIRNITGRRKTENALRESQSQLINAMNLSRMASWEYDAVEDNFVFNDRIYALFLTTAERLGGMEMSSDRFIRQFVHPDDAERFREIIRETVAIRDARYTSNLDFRLMRSDGEIRTIAARFGLILGAGGNVARVYGAAQDITEAKVMEQAIREANRKLNLLNSITRHDMVNQLTLLKGYIQLAGMRNPDPGTVDFMGKIKSAATMIERQLAFTKTYQELGIKAPAWFSLHTIVESVGRKEVRFSKTCAATEIFADPMVEKVFYNLFDNAIRHGQKVTEITIQCERGAGELIIIVEDNGSGIAAREKEKIFEKGYGKNTGFGLFLAKEILLLTGITISETGIPGEGARFEMHVPKGMYRFTGKHH